MEASDDTARRKNAAAAAAVRTAARPDRMTTAILFWCALAVVSSLYVTIPLTPIFARDFDASLPSAVWTGSSFSLAYAIGLVIWGTLSDRIGRKPVMAFGLLALAVLSPLAGLAGSLPVLIALRAAQGMAAATFAPAALAYASEMYPPRRSVAVIGLITTGFMSAGALGQLFAGAVEQALGWPYVFHLLGGIYGLSAAWLGGRLTAGTAPRRDVRLPDLLRTFGSLLRQKKLPPCYFIAGTLLLTFVGMYTGLEAVLTREPFALTPEAMLIIRAAGLPGVLLSPLAGRLAARFGLRGVLRAGLAAAAAGLLAAYAGLSVPDAGLLAAYAGLSAPAFVLTLVIPASFAVAAGIALAIPPLIAIIGRLGGEARAAAVTLYTFILFIGATLGPQAVLWTLQAAGRNSLPFLLLAALMSAAWMATRRLPDPDR